MSKVRKNCVLNRVWNFPNVMYMEYFLWGVEYYISGGIQDSWKTIFPYRLWFAENYVLNNFVIHGAHYSNIFCNPWELMYSKLLIIYGKYMLYGVLDIWKHIFREFYSMVRICVIIFTTSINSEDINFSFFICKIAYFRVYF